MIASYDQLKLVLQTLAVARSDKRNSAVLLSQE